MNQNEQARFDELLSLLLDGQIDEAQWDEFQDTLSKDERARRQYRQAMMVESLLERFQAEGFEEESHCSLVDSPSLAVRLVTGTRDFFVRPTPLSMAVAAIVIGLLVTAMAFMAPPFYRAISRGSGDEEPIGESPTFVAQLTGTHEAVWEDGQLTPSHGAHLQIGRRMELVSGVAEVMYRPGATVTIEGPAEWVVVEEGRMRLNYGSIVARVRSEAIGFAVVTPLAEITDLGTEFGVVTERNGATSTFVFQGSVELQPTLAGASESRVLKAGEGMRISGGGTIEELSEPIRLVHNVRLGATRGRTISFASYQYLGDHSEPRHAVHAAFGGEGYPDDAHRKLIDGKVGTRNHHDERWVGWYDSAEVPGEQDTRSQPSIVFDAGSSIAIDRLHVVYAVEHHLAIHAPDRLVVSMSDDGVDFRQAHVFTEFDDSFSIAERRGNGNTTVRFANIELSGIMARHWRLDFYNDHEWTFLSEVFLSPSDEFNP